MQASNSTGASRTPGAHTSRSFSIRHLLGLLPISGRCLTRGATDIARMRECLGGTSVSARRAIVALTLHARPTGCGAFMYPTHRAEEDPGCEIDGARDHEPDQGALKVVQQILNGTAAWIRRGGGFIAHGRSARPARSDARQQESAAHGEAYA